MKHHDFQNTAFSIGFPIQIVRSIRHRKREKSRLEIDITFWLVNRFSKNLKLNPSRIMLLSWFPEFYLHQRRQRRFFFVKFRWPKSSRQVRFVTNHRVCQQVCQEVCQQVCQDLDIVTPLLHKPLVKLKKHYSVFFLWSSIG